MADDTTNPEYKEYFDAVQRFQNGDPESALILVHAFKDFLDGFILLLRGGPVNRLTRSHRIFLSSFLKSSGLARSLKSGHPVSAAFTAAENALTSISIQLRPVDTEDMKQEVTEIFLGTLRRYRSRDNQNYLIPYIQVSFPYALSRRVRQLIKDPLVNLASDKILSLEELDKVHDRYADYSPLMGHLSVKEVIKHLTVSYEDSLLDVEEDELGPSWIIGETCDDIFDELSPMERRILRFYAMGMTDAKIATAIGVSYNTAIRRRHYIISKVRGTYVPPSCRFCGVEVPKASLGRQPRQCISCRNRRRKERVEARRKQAAIC